MKRALIPVGAVVALTFVVVATFRDARHAAAAVAPELPASMPGTSRAELTSTVSVMTARLSADPANGIAAVSLANALIRLQRVNNDGRAVITAEQHLRALLTRKPDHYDARRMLATVLLSQHRFGDAIAEANKAMAVDPRDAWNYGAAGDGYMELGDYTRAFEAFDRMGQLQPGPPAYARTSYALEIKGDLAGALEYMQRAADGTSPNDSESQAWHYTQVADLLLQLDRVAEARTQYERADATFPGHPLAMLGLARVKAKDGDLKGARLVLQSQLAKTATPDLAVAIGELSSELGDDTAAAQYFQMAEQIERAAWGNGTRQPQVLAKILSEQPRRATEAVSLAKEAARTRVDLMTMDTLAWAYFKDGQLPEAKKASEQALRTGTRSARIRCHAEEIDAALLRQGAAGPAISSARAPGAIRRCFEWRP
jgi:tetratricopeptide (TPR) repeat protein